MLRRLFAFFVLASVKTLGMLFYTFEIDDKSHTIDDWLSIRVVAWMNHTSLFDIMLVCALPYHYLWYAALHCITPVAEKTMRRPFVGFIFGSVTSQRLAVSQKRDASWDNFLSSISEKTIVAMFPEGRMKRLNGLDKHGRPLSVRSGIADILQRVDNGKLLIQYSGGMHHIQAPGQRLPRLFKKVRIRFECLDISAYKNTHAQQTHEAFKTQVINDLTSRRDKVLQEIGSS